MKKNLTLNQHKLIAVIIAVSALVLDQISKVLAYNFAPHAPDCKVIIPYVLDFRYLSNKGAAFGLFADKRWVFLIATTVFLAIAIYAFFRLKISQPLVNYALMLIISGGIGNMIDRIARGFVIDFINFSFVNFFVFNVADCCVVIGCALFVLYLLIDMIKGGREEKSDA